MARRCITAWWLLVCIGCAVETGPPRDASARIACQDFRRALSDASAGLLTTPEFRARVQRVHENARLADSAVAPGVSEHASHLLKAVTSGTTADAAEATTALIAACKGPGALGEEW
jgi:hypothetical protein